MRKVFLFSLLVLSGSLANGQENEGIVPPHLRPVHDNEGIVPPHLRPQPDNGVNEGIVPPHLRPVHDNEGIVPPHLRPQPDNGVNEGIVPPHLRPQPDNGVNEGIVPPHLRPQPDNGVNEGIVPPHLRPVHGNEGIVPPHLRRDLHTLPLQEEEESGDLAATKAKVLESLDDLTLDDLHVMMHEIGKAMRKEHDPNSPYTNFADTKDVEEGVAPRFQQDEQVLRTAGERRGHRGHRHRALHQEVEKEMRKKRALKHQMNRIMDDIERPVPSRLPEMPVDSSRDFPSDVEVMPEFVPSKEWQPVLPGQAVPPGLHVRMDMSTGEKTAKLIDPNDEVNEDAIDTLQPAVKQESVEEDKPSIDLYIPDPR